MALDRETDGDASMVEVRGAWLWEQIPSFGDKKHETMGVVKID